MRNLTVLSFCISLVALALAAMAYHDVDRRAAAVVDAREQLLIQRLKPPLDKVYSDFHVQLSPQSQDPKTIEDLIQPLFQLVEPVAARPGAGS
jgi:hypothetical protein